MLWLLAAANVEGRVDVDVEYLAFRLRWSASEIKAGLTPLIEKGFLILDSNVLADRLQTATTEAEAEAQKRDREKTLGQNFQEFWELFPSRPGTSKANKKGCLVKWKARELHAIADQILTDVRNRVAKDKQWRDGFVPNPETYINQNRWDDGFTVEPPPSNDPKTPPTRAQIAAAHIEQVEAWAASMRNMGVLERDIFDQVARVRSKYENDLTP
jgi:hypothetical protein